MTNNDQADLKEQLLALIPTPELRKEVEDQLAERRKGRLAEGTRSLIFQMTEDMTKKFGFTPEAARDLIISSANSAYNMVKS